MGLSRGGRERFSATIWPGFVDAMSTLLLVLIFALTIFMVLQSVLRERITTQDSELQQLGDRVAALSQALSTAQGQAAALDRDLAAERARLRASEAAAAISSCWRARMRARSTRMPASRFCSWLFSFCIDTTMPVGRWVIRTAESVVLTDCPPGPEER